ncbi:MAG: TonB family protein [Porphyrobacter sp.]|nr:TonB family protein [Porphyrobacter sp.]
MRRTLLALAALSAAVPAHAAPVVLTPSGQWNVDFADEKCRLIRTFGEGEDRHLLAFQQYWPARKFGMTIAGSGLEGFVSRAKTDLRLFETHEPIRYGPFAGKVEGFGDAVIYSNLAFDDGAPAPGEDTATGAVPLIDTAYAKQVRFIELRQRSKLVRLETGPMDAAFDVLNQCTMDRLRQWGLDPEQHRTAQSGPEWLNRDALVRRIVANYPREASAQGEQGIMQMRVIVAADGSVESCTMLKTTNTTQLESPACDVMKRAKFDPARDAAGQPFRSFYATVITYQIG